MEERGNQATGHKAAIHNPNVSEEAKKHSKKVLREEFGNETGYAQEVDEDKNLGNIAGGYKAAINNPNVSEEAKRRAEERLDDLE